MMRHRLTDVSELSLAVIFIVAGIAETIRAIATGDGGIVFWFGSLVGGGSSILLGRLAFRNSPWLHCTLVCLGCLAGAIATMWTIVVPLAALAVMVLAVQRVAEETGGQEAGRT